MTNYVTYLAKNQAIRSWITPAVSVLIGVASLVNVNLAHARTDARASSQVTAEPPEAKYSAAIQSMQLIRHLYAEYRNKGQIMREQLDDGLILERQGQKNILQQLPGGFRRYFSEYLTQMLIIERDCSYRSNSSCLMAFDPILAPVDPALADTQFYPLNKANVIMVTFRDKRTLASQNVRYRMVRGPSGWRIDDICYPTGYCLSGILSGRVD